MYFLAGPTGKRSGTSGNDDDDLAVVTDAAADGTGSESPTPVANSGLAPRLPSAATVDGPKVVCKYFFYKY